MVLSKTEWRALPKEERDNYTKSEAAKDVVERVSYAKVWGERAKDKSQYLSQLHTDYYNNVGHKYGLARGFSYDELSEEEKRGRKHKNKVVLEAERQAKVALDKVEKYAVLATIDKKELTISFLNIKAPVQEVMNAVNKELAIPIPTLIGQKAWREERVNNINAAIKAFVVAINAERDKQNEGVRKSVNKTYTYYMQNLNKQIEENKSLRAENDALKAENNKVKSEERRVKNSEQQRRNTAARGRLHLGQGLMIVADVFVIEGLGDNSDELLCDVVGEEISEVHYACVILATEPGLFLALALTSYVTVVASWYLLACTKVLPKSVFEKGLA